MTDANETISMYPDAWQAAYLALGAAGILLAQVRNSVAVDIVDALTDLRQYHGMGYMLALAQGHRDDRLHIVNRIHASLPEGWTSVTRAAVDAGLVAAARSLAKS